MIILNYNDWLMTKEYVKNIEKYKILDKIIIVDNKSTDNSYEFLTSMSNDRIEVLSTQENRGYAAGNNFGLNYALKNYEVNNFIISNPDIEVDENTIRKICECLDTNKFVAVSGLIKNKSGEIAKNFAWRLPKYYHILSETFAFSTFLMNKLNLSRFYDSDFNSDIKEVDVISGCFFGIKASVFQSIGLFDERTFLYGEENNLFFKLKKKDYKAAIIVKQQVTHFGGNTVKKNIKSFF
ncbi:glycosyltransferase family 2 protein, partial [Enterococcus faecium]|nr:glycosyltransferase family 2 protein [Enterococcus faecium]